MYIVIVNVSVFKHCIKLAKVTSYIHNPVQYTQVLQDLLASVGGLAEQLLKEILFSQCIRAMYLFRFSSIYKLHRDRRC